MTKEEFAAYQKERRNRIRGGEAITTVAGVAELYRELEKRMGELEKRVSVAGVWGSGKDTEPEPEPERERVESVEDWP